MKALVRSHQRLGAFCNSLCLLVALSSNARNTNAARPLKPSILIKGLKTQTSVPKRAVKGDLQD